MIDKDLNPWLLEVNLNPSLSCDSPLDARIKSAVLIDLLNIANIHNPNCLRVNAVPNVHSSLSDLHYSEFSDLKLQNMFRQKKRSTNITLKSKMRNKLVESSEKETATANLSDTTEKEMRILKEAEHEILKARKTGFNLIYPSKVSHTAFRQFFPEKRRLNTLLFQHL